VNEEALAEVFVLIDFVEVVLAEDLVDEDFNLD
jgi:hypothetical protein